MALLGALAKFGMGMVHGDGNTRQCMATVGRRLQAVVRLRRAALHLRRLRGVRRARARRLEPVHRASDHVAARAAQPASAGDHRHRSAQDRDGDGGDAAPARSQPKSRPGAVLRPGPPPDRATAGSTATSSTRTRPASTTSRQHVARVHARARRRRRPASTRRRIERLAQHRSTTASASRSGGRWASTRATRASRTAQAIINLALMTGNIGRPGTGANSITGQCNAMGSRLFSNTTNLLGGHDFTNAEHRAQGRRHPRHRRRAHPATQPSWAYDQIIEGIAAGQDQGPVGRRHQPGALVDQPARRCATCSRGSTSSSCRTCTPPPRRRSCADLVLPAAGWGEKEGTFINSERRIGLVKKVARAPGPGARRLLDLPADRRVLGLRRAVRATGRRPEAVFQILKELSRGQPCDITGIADYRMLDERGGIQWPLPEGAARRRRAASAACSPTAASSTPTAGRGSSSRSRAPCPSRPTRDYPFVLLTGRGSSAQWHTQTRTGEVGRAAQAVPGASRTSRSTPTTPRALGIAPRRLGRRRVAPRRACAARAFVTPTSCSPGQVFIPMHYAATNRLTLRALRSALAPAVVQALRRPRPSRRVLALNPAGGADKAIRHRYSRMRPAVRSSHLRDPGEPPQVRLRSISSLRARRRGTRGKSWDSVANPLISLDRFRDRLDSPLCSTGD